MRQSPSNRWFGAGVVDAVLRRPWPVVVLLVLLFGAMAWSAVREKSSTFDEIAHLTAGYSYWHYDDFRMQPENGNLPQRWAALPLVLGDWRFPGQSDARWHASNVWELGYEFFYTLGNDLDTMLWRGRGMIVLFGMALGVIVFVWSRRLFGVAGGLVSLAMYAFCPSLLAHSALATSDLAATLWFTAALGTFWMAMHRVSLWSVLASALAIGALFVSKMSAIVIVPVLGLLLLLRIVANRPLILAWRRTRSIVVGRKELIAVLIVVMFTQAVISVFVIWASYGFRYSTFGAGASAEDVMPLGATVESLSGNGPLGACVRFANQYRLLPESYLFGFAYAIKSSDERVAFLNGEISRQGWRSFFPYAFLVKTPFPTLLLLLGAIVAAIAHWGWTAQGMRRGGRRTALLAMRGLYRVAPLVVFLAVYWAIAIRTNLNIGHRHILPTYPMMFILGGRVGWWFQNRRWILRIVPLVAICWLVVVSLMSWPNYLAYFNSIAGGPRLAYRHLVDSSLDWGQDLPGLKHWIEADHAAPQEPIYLSYFGVGQPEYYGLSTFELPAFPDWRKAPETGDLRPGTYCISATNLQQIYLYPPGAWSLENEDAYQHLLSQIAALVKRRQERPQLFSQPPIDAADEQEVAGWQNVIRQFEAYRFARLCAYLRLREPDDSVGYSILIYNVSARELETALFRPISDWLGPLSHSD